MITLKGKYGEAKVFTDNVEETAMSQIVNLLNQPFAEGSNVRIMPDVHAGAGCVIGFTANLTDKVIPNLVGVDIGCFSGDTKIPLLNGHQKTLKELYEAGGSFWVYSMNESKKVVAGKATALQTRKNASLFKIIISGGAEIICTPDHLFMLKNGEYKRADELTFKDSLMPLYRTYQTRDGYEHIIGTGLTHKAIAEQFFGDIAAGFVIHHIDGNQLNNAPENLKIILANEHSRLHAKETQRIARLQSDEFKKNRKEKLNKNGFYAPELLPIKQETGIKNITKYMSENPEHFKNAVKGNGERGKGFLIKYNTSDAGIAMARTKKSITCEICGKKVKTTLGLEKHQKKAHNNHSVLNVEILNYKEDVYCLNVEKFHNFALSAGVFVHNCGMLVVDITGLNIYLDQIDDYIHSEIPAGHNNNDAELTTFKKHETVACYDGLRNQGEFGKAIGSLGGGNHFIEINETDHGKHYLVIHSGSRNLGKQVAEYYQREAIDFWKNGGMDYREQREIIIADLKNQKRGADIPGALADYEKLFRATSPTYPAALCFLIGEKRDAYLNDMQICQSYASLNRFTMAKRILRFMGADIASRDFFETIHNYVNFNDGIMRKGAVSARAGEKLIIPMNRKDEIGRAHV